MLSYDDLLELARSRRTVRGFRKDQDVPDEVVQKILEVARWAPSGANSQPWEFVVIRDPEMRGRIAELFLKQSEQRREMDMAVLGYAKPGTVGFRDAPVYILILGDPRVNYAFPIQARLEKEQSHFFSGLASAALYIHLAATSLGLVSQWVSSSSSPYMRAILKAWLAIPEPLRIYDMIPIGYPIHIPRATPRHPLEEMIHRERYEQAKRRTDEEVTAFIEGPRMQGPIGDATRETNK